MGYRPGRKYKLPLRGLPGSQVSSWLNVNPLSFRPDLWLDASDTATITSSGSPAKVSQWDDKSGNGYNFTQGTGALQPTTGASTYNNKNVLDFVSRNVLSGGDVLDLGTDNLTVLAVCNQSNTANSGKTLLSKYAFPATHGEFVMLRESSFLRSIYRDATGARVPQLSSFTDLTPFLWTMTLDRSVGYIQQRYRQAISQTVTFTADSGTSVNSDRPLEIGALWDRSGTPAYINSYDWTGSVAEILLFRRLLNDGELMSLSRYLTSKWGLLY